MVGKVTKNAMWKNYSKIRRCDKSSGTEYNLLLFKFRVYIYIRSCFPFVDHSIDCHWLLSLAVRYIVMYGTCKSLGKIVEVMCCHKKKLDGCVIVDVILHDWQVATNTLFKHFLQSDRPQLYGMHALKINWAMFWAKFSISRVIGRDTYMNKFASVVSKLFESVASCSEQTANQNTNITAEVCKDAHKRISGLTVRINVLLYTTVEPPYYVIKIQNGGAREISTRKQPIFIFIFLIHWYFLSTF